MSTCASEIRAFQALRAAWAFLSRWGDRPTVDRRDDIAQEAAIIAWRNLDRMRNPGRLPALVRTVSRRVRYRVLARHMRHPVVSLDADPGLLHGLRDDSDDELFEVAGSMVPKAWLLDELEDVLRYQTPLNRAILIAYYQGFSCAELAERYALPTDCVKVRIHRSRRRMRRDFEARVGRSSGRRDSARLELEDAIEGARRR